jgi:hypothetical protein
MDFFMENEELCTVVNLWDFQEGPSNQQAGYINQCFSNLEIFQARLLDYANNSIFPVAFFEDDFTSNGSGSR